MEKNAAPVGIVGGGPCGMMMALLLARQGVRSVIFERKTRISTHPKAMGISRRTAEIYRQMGLHAEIARGSLPGEERSLSIWAKSLIGEEFGRIETPESPAEFTPCPSMHCPQTWTEQVLFEALKAEPLAELRFGATVVGVKSGADSASITLSSGESFSFPWLLAADGAASTMRQHLGIETSGPGDFGHIINTMFRANYGPHLEGRKSILYQMLSQEYFEMFVAINGRDLWLMHHSMQPGEKPEDYSMERLAGIIRMASGLPDEPVEILSIRPWVLSPRLANEFRHGRVFLIGDAAARLSPTGGLGLNTGLQSAHNLAWKLAAVVRGEAGEKLLDTYHEERHGAARDTMTNTNTNTQELYSIITAGIAGDWDEVRDGVRHSRRGSSGLGQDLGVTYQSGALVPDGTPAIIVADPVNDYEPNARPGSRAPHLRVHNAQGEEISLLDFLGQGFCLLVAADGDGWEAAADALPVFRQGRDFHDPDGKFQDLYGLKTTGAVLVRPDGYIGARWSDEKENPNLRQSLAQILA